MKKTNNSWIVDINNLLTHYGQITRIVDYKNKTVELSNGILISGKDLQKFKRRLLNKKTDIWVKNVDNLLDGAQTEKEIKTELAKLGGNSCWHIHKNKIINNLNTGIPWNKGKTGFLGTPHTEESKLKISEKNKGKNNGMYGKRMSADQKEAHSKLMKSLILSGKFTPNSNNRNTHWDAQYNGKRYRSSWEALYQYFDKDALYETLRIPYQYNSKERVYIVDFVNHITKTCIEVKPIELCSEQKFMAKYTALLQWAENSCYNVILVNKEWICLTAKKIGNIDYTVFDVNTQEKIKKLITL
jgi:hypothetical protein